MATDITEEIVNSAFTERPHLGIITAKVKKALAAYYGDECLTPYIEPFTSKENNIKYQRRIEQTINHYDNYTALVINKYSEGIFKSKQDSRTTGNKVLDDYLLNDYYHFLVDELVPFAWMLPEVYLLFEKAPIDPDINPITEADLQQIGEIPKPNVIFPQYVISFEMKDDCKTFEWVAIARKDNKLEIITETKTALFDNEKRLIPDSEKEHGFGEVPVQRIMFSANQYYGGDIGHSFINDVINKSIGNLQFISMFIEACYAHLSLKLRMSKETYDQTVGSGLGNYNIILEDGGQNNVPTGYVAMPNVELDKLIEIIFVRIPATIENIARLRFNLNSSSHAASGISKLMDATPEASALAKIVEFVWRFDQRAVEFITKNYYATKKIKPKVVYPTQFDVRTATEQMTDITTLIATLSSGKVPSSPTANGQIMKRWYSTILPDLDAKQIKVIDKEIADFIKNGSTPKELINQLDKQFPTDQNLPIQEKKGKRNPSIKTAKPTDSTIMTQPTMMGNLTKSPAI